MPCLKHLPNETIETIVSFLELNDNCNSRPTSRRLAENIRKPFQVFLRRKHVDLTEHGLHERMQQKPGHPRCLVHDLVIIKVPTDGGAHDVAVRAEEQAKAQQGLDIEQVTRE
ncbi:hypothetical protein BDW66DRAFT_150860 [Aspergillus desertorum]